MPKELDIRWWGQHLSYCLKHLGQDWQNLALLLCQIFATNRHQFEVLQKRYQEPQYRSLYCQPLI